MRVRQRPDPPTSCEPALDKRVANDQNNRPAIRAPGTLTHRLDGRPGGVRVGKSGGARTLRCTTFCERMCGGPASRRPREHDPVHPGRVRRVVVRGAPVGKMPHPRSGDDQDTQQERAATRASAPRPDPTLSATASPGSKPSKHAVCRAAGCAKG